MGLCGSRCPWQKHVRILLTKEPNEDKFCLEIERRRGGHVVISRIPPDSKLARWSEAHPYKDVQVGDRVVSVNGALAPRSILFLFATANLAQDSVWIMIRRDPERAQRQMGSKATVVEDFLEAVEIDDVAEEAPKEEEKDECECAVCLEPLKNGERAVRLRCGHGFHFACFEDYLSRQNSVHFSKCPVCRCDLVERGSGASRRPLRAAALVPPRRESGTEGQAEEGAARDPVPPPPAPYREEAVQEEELAWF